MLPGSANNLMSNTTFSPFPAFVKQYKIVSYSIDNCYIVPEINYIIHTYALYVRFMEIGEVK
jgi:hypothetical protein